MNKKKTNYLILIIILILLWIGLWWFSLLIGGLVLFYYFFLKLIRLIKHSFLKKTIKSCFLFIFIFFLAISIKLSMFDVYKIPSASMNNTLFADDVIMVNKLKYGPKLPRSPFEIPWLNIAFYFNNSAKERMHENWWDYRRLSGTTAIKNGDVVVFTMFKKNVVIVKRCMGVAGDTITIKQGDIYINNKFFNPSNQILNRYEFRVNDKKGFYRKLDSLNLNIMFNRTQTNHFKAILSNQDKNILKKLHLVEGLTRVTDTLTSTSTAYPKSKYNEWNFDNYGPCIVPEKGMKIGLNPKNYELYNKTIKTHEDVKINDIDGSYFINDKEVFSYTFKQDYYFMMGDNRKASLDSRAWGVVPEERIIGKVQCILWSNYQNDFQWSRLLKAVK